jgi:GDPmannose 4,6-dehydratase
MWLIVQQDEGDDYVIASGVSRTVGELVEAAFGHVGLDPEPYVVVDPEFVRPPDPVPLVGDPSKAASRLGWEPEVGFEEMVAAMVDADLRQLSEEHDLAAS